MKNFLCILLFFVSTTFSAQQLQGEKIAHQIDSIIKVEKLDLVSILFHTLDPKRNLEERTIRGEIQEHTKKFKIQGQFIIVDDDDGVVVAYNFDKLIRYTIRKAEKRLNLYFQVF